MLVLAPVLAQVPDPVVAPAAPASPTPPVVAQPGPEVDALVAVRRGLRGYYRAVSVETNAARRDEAVRRSVASLFVLIRPLATSRITEGNPMFPVVRIAFAEGEVDVATPPVLARSPEDGSERSTTSFNRQTNHLTHRLTAAGLTQTMWTHEGSRTTRFVSHDSGRGLTLHVAIRSPRLPVPVEYTMDFARAN
jgi:hypothetical protein